MAEHRVNGDTHIFTLDDGATLEVRSPSYDSRRRLWAEVVAIIDGRTANCAQINLLDQRQRIDYHAVAAVRDGRIDWAGVLIDIVPQLQRALTGGSGAPPGFPLTSLGALLDEPDDQMDWLVDDLLPAGGVALLTAKPKVGKSTLARQLALSVARGERFLDRMTAQGAVIYLALEEKRSEVRKHFRAMGATGDEAIYIFASTAPVDVLVQIRTVIGEKQPALLIIDPLFKFTRVRDGNDYAQVTAALEPLLALARETGTHVLCVHHEGKGDRQGGDAILGSTAIFAAVDTAISLRRSERYRTISSTQRYGSDLEETTLRFDPATRVTTLGETKEAEEGARIGEDILAYLQAKRDPMTEAEIDTDVEGKTRIRRKALRDLVAAGKILRSGRGGKSDPFRYAIADAPINQAGNNNLTDETRKDTGSPLETKIPVPLFPPIYKEQENKNPKSDVTPHQGERYSCSRDPRTSFNEAVLGDSAGNKNLEHEEEGEL
jgi:hypothetical protein